MTTGHLIADRQFTFYCHIYLHHLDDARGQVVANTQSLYFIFKKFFYTSHFF